MRCPARFIAATALAAVSLVAVVRRLEGGRRAALVAARARVVPDRGGACHSVGSRGVAGRQPAGQVARCRSLQGDCGARRRVGERAAQAVRRAGEEHRTVRARRRVPHHEAHQRSAARGRFRGVDHFRPGLRGSERLQDRRLCRSSSTQTECRRSAPKWTGASPRPKRTPRRSSAGWPSSTSTAIAKAATPGWASIATGSVPPSSPTNSVRMIDRLPRLAAELPDLTRYLLEYPNATLANSTDFLYWQETQFGLRPTVRISHLVIQDASGSDGGRVEDAVREPLLLDRARTSRPAARSGARTRILAGDGQPQPIRRLERIHRPRDSRSGAE